MKIQKTMKIKDIEAQYPEVIGPDAGIVEAAQKMKQFDVGVLLVCERGRLIGLLTDRDITVRATAEGRDSRQTKVRDIMSLDPVCCFEDQEVTESVELMEQKQVRHLPVLDRARHLVGIVSLGDIGIRSHNDRLAGQMLNRVSAQPSLTTAF